MSGPVLIAPVRGRLQAHFRKWASRWSTVAVDTFHRIDSLALGNADSGHGWQSVFAGTPAAWEIYQGQAKQTQDTGTGNDLWAYVSTASADVRVRIRFYLHQVGVPTVDRGPGISYRVAEDGSNGWALFYTGGGTFRHQRWTTAPVWTGIQDYTIAALAVDTYHTMEVRTLGNTHECWVNDVMLGSFSDATFKTNTRHGLYSYGWLNGHRFDRFKCTRNV